MHTNPNPEPTVGASPSDLRARARRIARVRNSRPEQVGPVTLSRLTVAEAFDAAGGQTDVISAWIARIALTRSSKRPANLIGWTTLIESVAGVMLRDGRRTDTLGETAERVARVLR